MEYLVMECGLSYAVVLDSDGRFLKVPNLGYEVGQTLNHVVLQEPPSRYHLLRKRLNHWAALAACLFFMIIGGWSFWQIPMGTVRMKINPDIQMSVNRFDRVIGLEGLNKDGKDLIEGYRAYGKGIQTVSDELADRAVDMGYLSDGGQIALTVRSEHESWKTATEELLLLELEVRFENRILIVTIPAEGSAESHETESSEEPETTDARPIQTSPEQAGEDGDIEDDDDDDDPDEDDDTAQKEDGDTDDDDDDVEDDDDDDDTDDDDEDEDDVDDDNDDDDDA